jgi:hypothetical protein
VLGGSCPPLTTLSAVVDYAYFVHCLLDGLLSTGLIEQAQRLPLDVIDLPDAGCALGLGRQGIALLASDFGHLAVERDREEYQGALLECQRRRSARRRSCHARRPVVSAIVRLAIGPLTSLTGSHSRTVAGLAISSSRDLSRSFGPAGRQTQARQIQIAVLGVPPMHSGWHYNRCKCTQSRNGLAGFVEPPQMSAA